MLPDNFRLTLFTKLDLDQLGAKLVNKITMIGPFYVMYLTVGIFNVNSYRKYNSTATCLNQSDIFDKNMFDFHFTKTISAFDIPIFMAESVVTCMH